jgi:hypothetical protein
VKTFRATRPQRVVKTYGRDTFLVWLNPLLSTLEATLGLRVGLRSDADVLAMMQRETEEMERRGYRVVSADEYALPTLGASRRAATWYQVTYELTDGDPR